VIYHDPSFAHHFSKIAVSDAISTNSAGKRTFDHGHGAALLDRTRRVPFPGQLNATEPLCTASYRVSRISILLPDP
jgi:hypothetical protein